MLFAPSKFAAYLRLPLTLKRAWEIDHSLTGMSIAGYTEIDQQHPIFDGRRAWQHLESQLHMTATNLDALPGDLVEKFWQWSERFKIGITVDPKGAIILFPPGWMY